MKNILNDLKIPYDPLNIKILNSDDKTFKNILFIGDTHFRSSEVSLRNDLEGTPKAILKKWEFIAKMSHEYQALCICLGDFFNSSKENNIALLNKISEINHQFYFTPFTIVGNHDKHETTLQEDNVLQFMFNQNLLLELKDNKITIKTMIDGVQVEIGGTHYGSIIPKEIHKTDKNTEKVLWVTHHDLMFSSLIYDNMEELHEIVGVDLAVNGHIHATQHEIRCGQTVWCCPGNIIRLRKNENNHVPKIWLWNPNTHDEYIQKLHGINIPHIKDIFLRNYDINAKDKDTELKDKTVLDFVTQAKLNVQKDIDNNKTADADIVKHAINCAIDVYFKSLNEQDLSSKEENNTQMREKQKSNIKDVFEEIYKKIK